MVTLDMSFNNKIGFQDLKLNYNFKLTIGSYISFLSALQTSQVLHISMNGQLTYEPIVL